MRKDCAFSSLTEEQQADLFDWLSTIYDVVLKRIAQPPPYGFGIKTHINSLHRFFCPNANASAPPPYDLKFKSGLGGRALLFRFSTLLTRFHNISTLFRPPGGAPRLKYQKVNRTFVCIPFAPGIS